MINAYDFFPLGDSRHYWYSLSDVIREPFQVNFHANDAMGITYQNSICKAIEREREDIFIKRRVTSICVISTTTTTTTIDCKEFKATVEDMKIEQNDISNKQ